MHIPSEGFWKIWPYCLMADGKHWETPAFVLDAPTGTAARAWGLSCHFLASISSVAQVPISQYTSVSVRDLSSWIYLPLVPLSSDIHPPLQVPWALGRRIPLPSSHPPGSILPLPAPCPPEVPCTSLSHILGLWRTICLTTTPPALGWTKTWAL